MADRDHLARADGGECKDLLTIAVFRWIAEPGEERITDFSRATRSVGQAPSDLDLDDNDLDQELTRDVVQQGIIEPEDRQEYEGREPTSAPARSVLLTATCGGHTSHPSPLMEIQPIFDEKMVEHRECVGSDEMLTLETASRGISGATIRTGTPNPLKRSVLVVVDLPTDCLLKGPCTEPGGVVWVTLVRTATRWSARSIRMSRNARPTWACPDRI